MVGIENKVTRAKLFRYSEVRRGKNGTLGGRRMEEKPLKRLSLSSWEAFTQEVESSLRW